MLAKKLVVNQTAHAKLWALRRSLWSPLKYAFRSGVAGLSSLFAPDTEPLARQLREEFGTNWTTMQRIDDFVMGDRTPYHTGQLRRDTLRPLERDGRIEVRRPAGGRGFNADKGVRIRFR